MLSHQQLPLHPKQVGEKGGSSEAVRGPAPRPHRQRVADTLHEECIGPWVPKPCGRLRTLGGPVRPWLMGGRGWT